MKATIVKNDKFETIGFEVIQGQKTLFSWGIAPLPFNFIKEVDLKKWANEIFELVKMKAVIEERNSFHSKFFDIASSNNMLQDGKGVNFEDYDKYTDYLINRFENIVKNII